MLAEKQDIIKFLEADQEQYSKVISEIQNGVEKWVKNYCHKDFESTTYSEYYNGEGNLYLQLDHYPITALTRVATGRRTAIKVLNTSTETSATISVNSTGVILTKDGTSDATVTFATYTTMSTLIAAINLLANGWSAVIESSDYNSFQSSELLEMYGKSAINSNYVYLDMPEEATDDFEVYTERGELYRYDGWPEGHRNVYVKYTAGYADIPYDIQLAVKIICKAIYQKRNEDTFGVANYSVGDVQVAAEMGEVPKEAMNILNRYRRIII